MNTLITHPLLDTLAPKRLFPKGGRLVKFGTHTDYSMLEIEAHKKPAVMLDIFEINRSIDRLTVDIESMRHRIYKYQIMLKRKKAGILKDGAEYEKLIPFYSKKLDKMRSEKRKLQRKIDKIK